MGISVTYGMFFILDGQLLEMPAAIQTVLVPAVRNISVVMVTAGRGQTASRSDNNSLQILYWGPTWPPLESRQFAALCDTKMQTYCIYMEINSTGT
jgi:hypothetical protein